MRRVLTIIAFLVSAAAFHACGGSDPAPVDTTKEPDVWKPVSGDEEKEKEIVNPGESYYPKAGGSFRIVSYNVGAFSKYLDTSASTEMIAKMLVEAGADAVGLNECDSVNTRHPGENQVANLAKQVGDWQWWFGRAMAYRGGAYGNGVIVPKDVRIQRKYTVTLAKGSGAEQRGVAVVETDKFIVGAAHLDHTSSEARLAQIETVSSWADANYRDSKKPVFFLGDMNDYPDSETIAGLKRDWDLLSVTTENSYPSRGAKNCIDYIFHYKKSASVKVVGTHVMTRFHNGDVTMASDHLPIYVDVQF
ncbi:MAG: endonuclease/exonuclease/phosphatase family protein [Bacteroidales bacterium]|nr:endonuclease/exonuclease/phosphatase family protein [Bacteroidales bacterium]